MSFFTYLVKNKTTGLCYYGVRFGKNVETSSLWSTYFTSSKIVKNLIQQFGKDDFEYEIRKIFDNKEDAIDWESKVLRRLKVLTNSKFINQDYYQAPHKAIQNKIKTIFISNLDLGISIRIGANKPIPIGWINGNINNRKSTNKNYVWAFDPISLKCNMFKVEDVPKKWILGRPKTHKNNSKKIKSKGLKWYTNGVESKQFSKNDKIPKGWEKGRINKTNKGKIYITNGIIEIFHPTDEKIPEGWYLGRRPNINSLKNSMYITNGVKTKRIRSINDIPEGWHLGTHYDLGTMKGKKGLYKQTGRKAIILKDGRRKNWFPGDILPEGSYFMDKNFKIPSDI